MKSNTATRFPFFIVTAILLLASLTGCTAVKEAFETNAAKGATAGAVLGGVAGAVIAKKTDGNVAKGAIIGAAAGGAVGGGIGHVMDRQARELEESLEGADVVAVKDSTGQTVGVHIVFDSAILFDVDRYDLRPGVRQSLDTLAASLQRYPETVLVIVGHTDSDGSEQYNQRLSERRAEAVSYRLSSGGVASERMRAVGMGETSPVAPNDTRDNKQKNRRVEIGIVPVVETSEG